MKRCNQCNKEFEGEGNFCPLCGTLIHKTATEDATVLSENNAYAEQIANEEQFYQRFASKKSKGWVNTIAIICIITAIVSLGQVALENFFHIIDVVVYTALAVLIFKKKNWIYSLIVTCYGGVFSIAGLLLTGVPTGFFAIIAGIFATIALKKVHDAYKIYRTSGQLPTTEI